MIKTVNTKMLGVLIGLSTSVSITMANAAAAQNFSEETVTEKNVGKSVSNTYLLEAAAGINTLQSWYVPDSGLYQTAAWWNSANVITVLANFSKISGSKVYLPILQNTFTQAQKMHYGFLNHFYDDEGWWALRAIQFCRSGLGVSGGEVT